MRRFLACLAVPHPLGSVMGYAIHVSCQRLPVPPIRPAVCRERSHRRRRPRGPVDTKHILAHGHRSIGQDYVLTDVLGQGQLGAGHSSSC